MSFMVSFATQMKFANFLASITERETQVNFNIHFLNP